MTEQEIVNCLKENHNKGIAYLFMSEDVWDWVREHLDEPNLLYLNPSGKWKSIKDVDFDDFDNFVFCLSETYELSQKPNGEWVEFELKDGMFYEVQRGMFYSWYEWSKFMSDNPSFTHFGGYYYGIENIPRWYMNECVAPTDCIGSVYESSTYGDKNIKPLTPKKIRFWRKAK